MAAARGYSHESGSVRLFLLDEEDLHLYFKYFNHEATDGEQPTDSEEDEDKWGYTGCAEMLKTGRGASFTWPHLRAAV